MTTKERAIAAVAALRDRPHNRYLPPALNEELVDAVLDAIREPSERDAILWAVRRKLNIPTSDVLPFWQAMVDGVREGK